MNRRNLALASLLLSFSLPAAAGEPLQVVARAPAGPTQSRRASDAVTATFNRPMVALGAPEDAGRFCPLKIEPPVKGRCRWQGTQILVFEPEQPLPPATEFRAVVPAGTRSQVSGEALESEAGWTFETLRPALVGSRPRHDEKWIDLKGEVFLHFNMEMDPREARGDMVLEERGLDGGVQGEVSLGVRRAKPEEIKAAWPWHHYGVEPSTANVLAVKPAALKPDRSYRLRLRAGLRAAEGKLGLALERGVAFETWYPFRAVEFPAKECLPAGFQLAFSNPVRYKDLMAHLSVEPSTSLPALSEDRGEWTGSRQPDKRLVYFGLPDIVYQPDTLYAFKIDGGLKDVFGNELGADVRFTLETGGYCPRLRTPSGFGILEGYLPPRHPVDAVNILQAPMEKAYIPDGDFIPFYLGEKWGCDKSAARPGGQAKLWDLTLKRNARLRTFVDLAGAFPTGQKGGLVFTQIQEPGGCWLKAVDDVTRIGLTVKDAPDSTLIWASFLRSGAPYGRLPVELRDDGNKVLWQGVTDGQGFAKAPGFARLGLKDWKRWQRPRLWVFARDANGAAVMATDWRGGLSPWRFDIPTDPYPRSKRFAGSLFSERGVYRPGETVRLKGMLRRLENGDWVPLGRRDDDPRLLRITITDSRDAVVVQTTVAVSGYSAFAFSQALGEGAATGLWSVTVTEPVARRAETVRPAESEEEGESGEREEPETYISLSQSFRVEAFKPASFEVKVAPGQASYLARDTYTAVVDGWYLFGAPMSEAPADWTLRLEPSSYEPPGYEGFDFSPGWWRSEERRGRVAASAAGKLDKQGRISVQGFLDPGQTGGPLAAVLEAGVMSPERQRLFGRATATVHQADLYFGIKPKSYFAAKGQPWSAEVVAARPDGTPARGLAARFTLVRRDWLSVQRAGLGGRLEWVTEQRDTTVSTGSWTTDGGTHTWTDTLAQAGCYFLSVSGQDEAGRPSEAAVSFYVIGPGEAWWARSDNDVIELVADKKLYRPGETARILVKSPYPRSRALVTLEREGVMSHQLVQLEGGASFVDVPLSDRHVPNVFVGVMLVQGRAGDAKYAEDGSDLAKPQVKFGYVDLAVDPGGRRLSVEASSDRPEYRPQDTVTVSLRAKDEAGRPAPGAELTVFVVDEGVLALTGYRTPDVFSDFYGPRPLLVATADSRLYVIGQRSFGEKGESRGGGGGRGAGLEGVDLRSRFVPTAYWNPSVIAGPDGRATVRFPLPDNLSRFRVMAVAQAGKRFGSGEGRFTVKKPLLLRPSLPRLARAGDAFDGGVVVHNYTTAAATVTVALELAGGAVTADGEPRRELLVAAGEAVETVWKCRAAGLGKTSFRFKAAAVYGGGERLPSNDGGPRPAAGAETDGLEWTVPVRAPERLETAATAGVVEAEPRVEELSRPQGSFPGLGAVKATLSPTALAGLQAGARFLLEYPYGCLEQRLSRMLPVVTAADLTAAFGLGTMGGLKAKVQSELDRLGDFQSPSGGFGYWPRPQRADPYVTSYALEVAALAKKEGYRLPAEVLARARTWLKTTLTAKDDWAYPYNESEEYASRAYAVYALALHGEPLPGYFQQLFLKRELLPFLAKAHLIKAASLVSRDPAQRQALAADILNQARQAPRSLHFEEPSEVRMPWVHESTVKATALSLQALLEAQGGFPDAEKAVYWLVNERKAQGRWRTTQENAAALRALQDFYRAYEKVEPNFTADLSLEGGSSLWSEKFQGRTLLARSRDFRLPAVFVSGDKARLLISKKGEGRLYYTLAETYAPASFDKSAAEGFEIEKSVKPLYGRTLKAGGRAVVTLTVRTKQDRTFVAMEDPLPAGFEIVDPSFAVEGQEDARALAEQGARGQYWGDFERAENYDDRIQVFADFLSAGEHRYSYLVQATTPGEYHWPSATVEQMYEPEVFGRTASQAVTIER